MIRIKLCFYCSLVVAFVAPSETIRAQKPPADEYGVTAIGLTGGIYQYTSGSGLYLYSAATGSNQAGDVIGYSNRYNASGASQGQDSWLYNGSATVQIGLTGGAYQYTTSAGAYQYSDPMQINAAGQVLGYSNRYSASGASLGYDDWLYNGSTTVQVGLTGANYSYTTSGGTFQESDGIQINSAGQAIGESVRFNSSGTGLGYDSWFYNGSTTVQIGLIGDNYSYKITAGTYEASGALAINSSGQVLGFSYRYSSAGVGLGNDAWLYSGGVSKRLGLSGSTYQFTSGSNTYQYSYANFLNDAGLVAGWSSRVDPNTGTADLGADSWLYNGGATAQMGVAAGATVQIGLTGGVYTTPATTGMFQYSMPSQLGSAGQVTGYSLRYNSAGGNLGQDPWIYNGSTVQIGLTGSAYQYAYTGTGGGTFQYSAPVQINSAGQVIGTSNRYNSSGTSLGQDSWLFNGSTTVQIGMTSSAYQYAYTGTGGGTYQSSTPIQINSAGQVIGTSNRYNASGASLGQGGWFYNGSSTVELAFSFRSSDNFSITTPALLTNQGVVLGSYELYSGTNDLGSHAFWWSQTAGFYDLGSLTNGTPSATAWLSLANVFASGAADANGAPLAIIGSGELASMSGGQLVFELNELTTQITPTPEPKWTLALSALAACLLALGWRSSRPFALRTN